MQTTTTLKLLKTKDGTSGKGPWTLSIFTGGDGREYSTLDGPLASKINSLDGSLLTVTYSERQNGKFTNYSVEGVEPAAAGATPAPAAAPASNGAAKAEFRTPRQIMATDGLKMAFDVFIQIGQDPILGLNDVFELAAQITDEIESGAKVKEAA